MSVRRRTRMIGLHDRAVALLAEANGGSAPEPVADGETYRGVHDEPLPLYRYHTARGGFQEYVQAAPWLGGPVVFKALLDDDGQAVDGSAWSDQEMDEATLRRP